MKKLFIFLCVWFCVLTSFWGGKPSASSSSTCEAKLLLKPHSAEPCTAPVGTGPSVSFMLVELVQPISLRNQWEALCFQANISAGEAGRAPMPFAIQTTCDCFIQSWAASWACGVSSSLPINTSGKRRSDSAPCQALTSGKWVLTPSL